MTFLAGRNVDHLSVRPRQPAFTGHSMASAQDPRGGESDDRFVPYLLLFFQFDSSLKQIK
jgi:hypothetical protein